MEIEKRFADMSKCLSKAGYVMSIGDVGVGDGFIDRAEFLNEVAERNGFRFSN